MLSRLLLLIQRTKALCAFSFAVALMLAPAWKAVAQGFTVTSIYNFTWEKSNGSGNVSSLVADQQGALYGTTYYGGEYGDGTVFKLTPAAKGETAWTETVLYSFCQQEDCSDGENPVGGLIFAKQPNGITALFGTTSSGGNNNNGNVFRLEPPKSPGANWTFTSLYTFEGEGDASVPLGSLIADNHGVLYGTTNGGGTGDCNYGCGTIFKLTPPDPESPEYWTETVLYSFPGGSGGQYPKAGLIADHEGVFYGTTYEGGTGDCIHGCGTIFKLTPPATGETAWTQAVLHNFAGGDEGANPRTGLVADVHGGVHGAGGGLYGTTAYAGANCSDSEGCGTVFKLVPPDKYIPKWTLSTLHSFKENYPDDGEYPLGGLVFGKDGSLYGTTEYGGTPTGKYGPCGVLYRCGTIFKLSGADVSWTLTYLYKFCSADTGCPAGAFPTAGLTAYKGALYGTTSYASDGYFCDCGAVFKLNDPSE